MDKIYDISFGKMSTTDKVVNILKAGMTTCPVLSSVASLLSDFQNQKQYKIIEDVLNKFVEMVNNLDERVKNLEYMNGQDFAFDIIHTIDQSKDEIDEDRRSMYARYLAACCHIDNHANSHKRIFLDYVGKMDAIDFFILKSLGRYFIDRNAVEDVVSSYKHEYKKEISSKDVLIHFQYLESLNIVEMPEREEVDSIRKDHNEKLTKKAFKKERIYQRTALGDELYQFISKVNTPS